MVSTDTSVPARPSDSAPRGAGASRAGLSAVNLALIGLLIAVGIIFLFLPVISTTKEFVSSSSIGAGVALLVSTAESLDERRRHTDLLQEFGTVRQSLITLTGENQALQTSVESLDQQTRALETRQTNERLKLIALAGDLGSSLAMAGDWRETVANAAQQGSRTVAFPPEDEASIQRVKLLSSTLGIAPAGRRALDLSQSGLPLHKVLSEVGYALELRYGLDVAVGFQLGTMAHYMERLSLAGRPPDSAERATILADLKAIGVADEVKTFFSTNIERLGATDIEYVDRTIVAICLVVVSRTAGRDSGDDPNISRAYEFMRGRYSVGQSDFRAQGKTVLKGLGVDLDRVSS